MYETFPNGFSIRTFLGNTVTVEDYLAEGGEGIIYLVDYNGKKKVMKWFRKHALGRDPGQFYEAIKWNTHGGAPSPAFLWPLDLTEWADGSFGYVMDLIHQGHRPLTDFLLRKVRFQSFTALTDAALNIVSACRILHSRGYCFSNLDDGVFFIDPASGSVRICSNDYISPEGLSNGFLGKPRYMAPELVIGKSMPDSRSDRFSMAVILYMLFCMNHPLEGRRSLIPVITPHVQERLYGSDPLFVMDPDDDSNAPHPVLHKNSIVMWNCLPDYLKQFFISAFSRKALHHPSARPNELQWQHVLTRFRSGIVRCSCGNEIFIQDGRSCSCEACGNQVSVPCRLVLTNYAIPVVRDAHIFRCQLGLCNPEDALSPIALVVESPKNPGVFGLLNKSRQEWTAVTSSGRIRTVAPGQVVPVKPGISFTACGETVVIDAQDTEGENQVLPNIPETPADAAIRRDLHLMYIMGTPGCLHGSGLGALNRAMEETVRALHEMAPDCSARLKLSVMEYNTLCRWITADGPADLEEEFNLEPFTGGGMCDLGHALQELNDRLSRKEFLNGEQGVHLPILIFMLPCSPTDHFEQGLSEICRNKWFRYASRICIAWGEDADRHCLAKISDMDEPPYSVGDPKVFLVSDPEQFPELLRTVSIDAVKNALDDKLAVGHQFALD